MIGEKLQRKFVGWSWLYISYSNHHKCKESLRFAYFHFDLTFIAFMLLYFYP